MYGLAGLQSVGHVLYLHIEDTVSSAVLWASCHQGPHSVGNLHLDPRMPLLRCLIKQGSVVDNKCDAPAISCIVVFAMLYPHMTIVTGDSRSFFWSAIDVVLFVLRKVLCISVKEIMLFILWSAPNELLHTGSTPFLSDLLASNQHWCGKRTPNRQVASWTILLMYL